MEDFEYSVEICDRDWECFFAECEECNLLPPSLADVDNSGMSDIDDTGSLLAKRAQRVDRTAGFSETDRPIDGPPHCEGSPVEYYLSKHGIGGLESVLSGSEEDIHLQSVNIFFERVKSLTEVEPSQVTVGNNREAIQEKEQCSDGSQASGSTLPKNITMRPVDSIRNINTKKNVEAESCISPELAASNSALKTNKLAESELFVRDEARTEARVNEVTAWNPSHDSPDRVVCSETTLHIDNVEACTPLDGSKTGQLTKTCDTDFASNLKAERNVKWREYQTPNFTQSDTRSTSKAASQELSPSASIKRKRRKKRRLSAEPGEGGHGYERRVSVKQSDSEEEQHALRGGESLCLSEDIHFFYLNEPQKNLTALFTPYSATSNFPVNASVTDIKVNDVPQCDSLCQYLPESVLTQRRCTATGSAENNAANNRSVPPLGDDSVMSAPNNSANVAANLQPCSKLQVEESAGPNKYSGCPVSVIEGVTTESDVAREHQIKYVKAGGLQQSGEISNSVIGCENGQNLRCCATEVKSVSLSPSAESNAPAVEVSQSDKLSAAKSALAADAGNSGRDEHTLCQSELQQQLETAHNAGRYSARLEKTHFSLSATVGIPSHALNTKPQHFKTDGACPFQEEVSKKDICTDLTSVYSNPSPDKSCLSKNPSSLDINDTVRQTECPQEVQTLLELDVLSKNTKAERDRLAASRIMVLTSTGQAEPKLSLSKDLLKSPSDITHVSSCCTLDTGSLTSLSNENVTGMSASFHSSDSEHESGGQGEKKELNLEKRKEEDAPCGHKSQPKSNWDLSGGAEDSAIAVSKAKCEPERGLNSVFAMSSFWSEMEKLTINDILGLRMISRAAPPSSLPPLQESEETDVFTTIDSGCVTQLNESKPEQTNEDKSCVSDSVDRSSSRSVTWESEPEPVSRGADIYPVNMMLTPVTDTSQPVLSDRPQKISKNVSVDNLHALESFSYTRQGETLQTLDEGQSEKGDFPEGYVHRQDKDIASLPSSLTDSYSISLTAIFQYLFGGQQSLPSQSATDNITTVYNDGASVPETYDHFFSEFDTESFFYPLIKAADKAKDRPVPIFSYSRSANRNLQFPEAYDYFFATSSSDDSSAESDEEDNYSPVRVVTKFSCKGSSTQISTDIYEDFFTDSDLRQNLFWKTTLSFRNINFTASTVQKQRSNSRSLIPGGPSDRSLLRTVPPLNALGHQDVKFPDPLLYHLEDRISRQLAQQPFRYEDLQTTVSNPRLDASFLPLRQSDMCLVCIAFASWVLKTANPQVGDAWKAVLLANVSALSAIRYLRKYVKMEAAALDDSKSHLTKLSD